MNNTGLKITGFPDVRGTQKWWWNRNSWTRVSNWKPQQGSKLQEKINFPLEMLQKILPFRPNFNLSDWQTSAFFSIIEVKKGTFPVENLHLTFAFPPKMMTELQFLDQGFQL